MAEEVSEGFGQIINQTDEIAIRLDKADCGVSASTNSPILAKGLRSATVQDGSEARSYRRVAVSKHGLANYSMACCISAVNSTAKVNGITYHALAARSVSSLSSIEGILAANRLPDR